MTATILLSIEDGCRIGISLLEWCNYT